MTAEPRPRSVPWRAIPLAAALLAGSFVPRLEAQLPEVATSFQVSASVAELLQNDRTALEDEMATELARVAKERFGFLSWKQGTDAAQPRLEIRMTETGSICEPILSLHLVYLLNADERSFANVPDELLYGSCDAERSLQTGAEVDLFRDKIKTTLARFFDTDDKRQEIQTAFLSEIRLSDRLEIDHQQQAVFLPFSWEDLQASEESELKVAFLYDVDPAVEPRPGSFHLQPIAEWLGLVQCQIRPFTFAGLINVPQQTDYHSDLATLFSEKLTEMGLYMVKYTRDPNAGFRSGGSDALRDF